MTGILIFMVVVLFIYTLSLRYYHLIRCPKCHSIKVTVEKLKDHHLFLCKTCKFSYKDYDAFYYLTPISDHLDIDFIEYDEEDDKDP